MTPSEFFNKFMSDDPLEGPDLPSSAKVYLSESVVNRKQVSSFEVWAHEGQFFKVTYTRSNSGYWTDSEYDAPVVTEVFPYQFSETRYKEQK